MLLKNSSFKEFISKELELSSAGLSFHVKSYLTELLNLYLSSDQFFEKKEGQSKSYEHTLVELYKKSQNSNPQEKIFIFKRMGDFSLYLCGFFRSAIEKKIVHISYYEDMGQSAYDFVSSAYGSKPNVFRELSDEFKHLSKILFSIQKKSEQSDSNQLLKKLLKKD